MTKIYLNIFIWNLCIFIFIACNNKNNKIMIHSTKPEIIQKNNCKLKFDSILYVIDSKVEDLTSPSDLFSITEFKEIYESPFFYLDSVLSFLNKSDATTQQKIISIYSMQNLELSQYLVLCNHAIHSFSSGKINEQILKSAITPDFANKYPIIKNFEKTEVVKILENLTNDKKISTNFRKTIRVISTGKAWKDIKAFYKSEDVN